MSMMSPWPVPRTRISTKLSLLIVLKSSLSSRLTMSSMSPNICTIWGRWPPVPSRIQRIQSNRRLAMKGAPRSNEKSSRPPPNMRAAQ